MKALPSVIVGCLLTWSAAILPAQAQNASGGGGTLIMYSGHSTGMLSVDGSAYTPYSGGDIAGVNNLTILNTTQDGILHDVGALQKSGTGLINFAPSSYAGGTLVVGNGGTFTPAGAVTLTSGSTASFEGSVTISDNVFDAGATLVTNATSTVGSGASISLSRNSSFTGDGTLTLASGSVFLNGGTGVLGFNSTVNNGFLTFGTGGTITSGGVLTLGTGSILTASNVNVVGATINTGTLNLGGGTLQLNGTSTYIGTGATINTGNFGGILLTGGSLNGGNVVINAASTLNILAGGITQASQVTFASSNSLTVNLAAGTQLGRLPLMKNGVAGSNGTSFKFLDGVLSNASTMSILYLPAAQNLVSDPLSLHISEFDTQGVHDKYVLEMSYNPASVASLTDLTKLYLAWFDPSDSTWKNAVDGNSDGGSSAQQIIGAYNPTTDFNLGYYGVDVTDSMVWAVVDHNSTFGVAETDAAPSSTTTTGVLFTSFSIPEPSSVALLLCGLAMFGRRSRRK